MFKYMSFPLTARYLRDSAINLFTNIASREGPYRSTFKYIIDNNSATKINEAIETLLKYLQKEGFIDQINNPNFFTENTFYKPATGMKGGMRISAIIGAVILTIQVVTGLHVLTAATNVAFTVAAGFSLAAGAPLSPAVFAAFVIANAADAVIWGDAAQEGIAYANAIADAKKTIEKIKKVVDDTARIGTGMQAHRTQEALEYAQASLDKALASRGKPNQVGIAMQAQAVAAEFLDQAYAASIKPDEQPTQIAQIAQGQGSSTMVLNVLSALGLSLLYNNRQGGSRRIRKKRTKRIKK
jgi:hypothetical protein